MPAWTQILAKNTFNYKNIIYSSCLEVAAWKRYYMGWHGSEKVNHLIAKEIYVK